jgi:ABC-type sugar transport system substrate-binding protein
MRRITKFLAVPLALSMVVAACGSDEDATDPTEPSGETTPGTDDGGATTEPATSDPATTDPATTEPQGGGGEGLAAAQAVVDANLTPPDKIGPTIPLESVPEPKTVAWLQCSLPSCAAIGEGFKKATDLLGWTLEVISYDTDAAAPFQQAIDLGVDYVASTGTAPELIQDQIDAAAAAGIGYFSCFDTADPGGEANNIWTQCGDDDAVTRAGDLIANAIIADSGGTANVLMVNIPDFAVLVNEREGSEAAYAANCPDCTFNELALTLDQLLAGEVPGAVVAAVQSDPEIEYIHFAFDGLTGGVSSTLAEAGLLEGRKLVGVDYSGAVLQEIVDGTQQFWTTNPKEYSAWIMVDGMARHSIGQENTEERANALLPTFIVNSPETAEPLIASDGWPGPDGMAEQFAALWGV